MSKGSPHIVHINDIAGVGGTLNKTLKELGYRSDLFELWRPGAKSSILLKALSAPLRALSAVQILWQLRNEKSVLLHVHYFTSAFFFAFTKHKLIIHAHGTDIREPLSPIRQKLNSWIATRAYKIIYSTPDLLASASRLRKDAIYLPNPIPFDVPEKIQSVKKIAKILVYSALNENKGADTLIEAGLLMKDLYDVKIDFLRLGTKIEKAEENALSLIAPVAREQIQDLISGYDLVIGQQKIGALGMSELESMALGKPTICYLKDFSAFADCPILRSQDAVSIVRQVQNIINNPERGCEISKQSRQWVIENYERKAVTQKLLRIYDV